MIHSDQILRPDQILRGEEILSSYIDNGEMWVEEGRMNTPYHSVFEFYTKKDDGTIVLVGMIINDDSNDLLNYLIRLADYNKYWFRFFGN